MLFTNEVVLVVIPGAPFPLFCLPRQQIQVASELGTFYMWMVMGSEPHGPAAHTAASTLPGLELRLNPLGYHEALCQSRESACLASR